MIRTDYKIQKVEAVNLFAKFSKLFLIIELM